MVAGGFLLTPQAAQAQQNCPELSTPTITVTPGDEQLTVSWSALTTGQSVVDQWNLSHRKGSDGWQEIIITDATARSYTLTNLENGASYRFKLYADSTCGDSSEDSNTVSATPAATASPGVTISKETLPINEGASGTYTVVLDTKPGGNVTVTPSSGDTGAATVSGALTFTTANWETAKTVTVTGVSDTDTTNESVTVSHGVTGYGAVTSGPDVTVAVTDTTVAGKTITLSSDQTSNQITEGNTGKKDVTVTVALSEAAPSGGLILEFAFDDSGTATLSNSGSTSCTAPDPADADVCWIGSDFESVSATSSSFTWKFGILGDTRNEVDETVKLRATADGWTTGTLTITIKDNDSAVPKPPTGLTIVPGPDRLYLSWTVPTDPNRTGWRVRYREAGGTWPTKQ